MNHNGNPAIILIYLMTMLPDFVDRKCQRQGLADATIDLYSDFKNKLNATTNFAEYEYEAKTSGAMDKIYDLTGKNLYEQLKQQQTFNSKIDNYYADKSVTDAVLSAIIPPAVASAVAANTGTNIAKRSPQLINAQVVGSDVNQLGYRRARKICKAGRKSYPRRPHRARKPYSEMSILWGQSSRPKMANRKMQPLVSSPLSISVGVGKLSSITAQSQERQSATPLAAAASMELLGKYNADCQWSKGSRSVNSNAVADVEMNELSQYSLPNDKWRKKLQIDGKKRNLINSMFGPNIFRDQLNKPIKYDEEMKEISNKRRGRQISKAVSDDYKSRIKIRNAGSYPEVFSGPVVDSSVANGLSEVIQNANSRLTSGTGISNSPQVSNLDDVGHRIGKEIQQEPQSRPHTGVILPGDASASNLTNVMERVLGELESLKECRDQGNTQPEGSPCDITGSWNSETIGLQFHISLAETTSSSRAYLEGKKLEIELTERVTPKKHDLMDCDWYLAGSTVKQYGGPFYITAQKTDRYIVATFAGLCRTCGGIPIIFGSWTFVYSAKDCQDVSLAVENKRDILRKDTLDAKRKHRLSKLGDKGKKTCPKCS